VLSLLAATLGLARGDVKLVSGAGSRDKVVEVAGIPPEEADRRLASAGSQAVVTADRASPETGPPRRGDRMSIDTARFRGELLKRREQLQGTIKHHDLSGASLLDETGELMSSSSDNHLADTATETYERELDEGLEEDAERQLREVETALDRIENGTYGRCEVCGLEIPEERLEAIPWTTMCIDDARKLGG